MSEDQMTERDKALAEKQAAADKTNSERKGKGTRVRVGQTRGKNPQIVVWEAFDESLPDTLPATVDEFNTLTATTDEKLFLSYLIDGYNSAQYTAASDPIAEYVNPAWDAEMQKQFRVAVRNYTAAMQSVDPSFTLEKGIEAIKPNIDKAFAGKK